MSLSLQADQSLGGNLRRIAFAELKTALDAAEDDAAPLAERVHTAHKQCKALRALLRLVAPAFDDYPCENAAIRDAAHELGAVRDGTVLTDVYQHLLADADPGLAQGRSARLQELLATGSPDGEAQTRALQRFVSALQPVNDRAPSWRLDEAAWSTVLTGATDTYRRAGKRMATAARTWRAVDFHEWRKQVKYHRAHLKLMRNFFGGKERRLLCKEVADLLGDHHDLQVLRLTLLSHALPGDTATRISGAVAGVQKRLAKKALETGAALFERSPRQWCAELEGQLPDERHPAAGGRLDEVRGT